MRTEVTEVKFTSTRTEERRTGLLGYLAVVINEELKIDGLTLRQTRAGRLTLSFPSRRDSRDREHFIVMPISDASRLSIERQVLRQLVGKVTLR